MIDWIRGKICDKEPTRVVVEVVSVTGHGGLAFSISIPLPTYEALGEVGDDVKLFIHPVFSHDKLELFGFKTQEERRFFCDLLLVQGIGPQSALRIISSVDFLEFKRAVCDEDIGAITSIKGISEKRASKLILELKEKYKKEELPESLEASAIRALVGLGIDARRARELAHKVRGVSTAGSETLEELIKEALRRL